jgi:putative transcriptional regulator
MRSKTATTKADRRVIAAVKQARAYLRGDKTGARETQVWVVDVKALRRDLAMSQQEFATAYGIPVRTVQSWEQGVRQPDATAQSYLRAITRLPKQVRTVLSQ